MNIKWKHILAALLSMALTVSVGMGAARAEDESSRFSISYSRVADLKVFVDGEPSGDLSQNDIVCGEIVRLTAPAVAGKTFSHWAFDRADGTAASTRATFRFTLNGNTTIYAVYGADTDKTKPCVAFSSTVKETRDKDTENEADYIRMTASYSLPSGVADPTYDKDHPLTAADVKGEIGIRYTTNRMLGYGDPTANLLESAKIADILKSSTVQKGVHVSSYGYYFPEGDWTLGIRNPGTGVHVYAVAYVTYNGQTVFSDVKDIVFDDLQVGSILSANMSIPFSFEMEGE